MYTVRPPFFLKWFYPDLIWRKEHQQKIIYLTFDDGPIPNVTEFVLNTLKKYNIKGTFFCIGENISKNPTIFNRIKDEDHQVGNHTYNHLKGWDTDTDSYLENYIKCQSLTQNHLFRPPYGRIKKEQIKSISSWYKTANKDKLNIVMWDVLSGDFDLNLSPETCYQNVIKNTRNGSIIVFHDSIKAEERIKYALPKIIEYFKSKDFKFEKL